MPHGKIRSVVYSPACAEWAWTTGDAPDGWTAPSFDDSSWARGKAGFGNANIVKDHGDTAKVATTWSTPVIRLRRVFQSDGAKGFAAVTLNMFHDEDVVVWLNGERLFCAKGYNSAYEPFPVDAELFSRLLRSGANTLAVEVRQTVGGQYFDLSLEAEME